jgi:uncharacterized SAM-binding protein YcdF (DUF218 family)
VSVDAWARVLWDYHHVHHALEKAECIIVLGSHDTRVAERGADVFLEGWAPLLVFSGHLGALTSGMWSRPEAEVFAEVAAARGVPRERILVESRSTNTGENVDFSKRSAGTTSSTSWWGTCSASWSTAGRAGRRRRTCPRT